MAEVNPQRCNIALFIYLFIYSYIENWSLLFSVLLLTAAIVSGMK